MTLIRGIWLWGKEVWRRYRYGDASNWRFTLMEMAVTVVVILLFLKVCQSYMPVNDGLSPEERPPYTEDPPVWPTPSP